MLDACMHARVVQTYITIRYLGVEQTRPQECDLTAG